MLEVGGDLDLGEEPVAADDGTQFGVEDLDGDLAGVLQVLGEIDGGHAALAQLALEAVAVGECRRQAIECCRHRPRAPGRASTRRAPARHVH